MIVALICNLTLTLGLISPLQASASSDLTVKVLIQKTALNSGLKLCFETDQKFWVWFNNEPDKKYTATGPIEMTVQSNGTTDLFLSTDGKKTKATAPSITITPASGHLGLNGKRYEGSFKLHAVQQDLIVVNHLPLERYIYGVLKTESWPGWPLEIDKVLAIAARSYVLHKVQTATKEALFHIKDSSMHQTYHGSHDTPKLWQAVEETRGIFLGYGGKPILAMFDICCGGIVPGQIQQGINFAHAPYLKRPQACTWCQTCKSYEWKYSFTITQMEELLRAEFPKISGLKEMRITRRDRAGIVSKITIKDKKRTYILSGRRMYSIGGINIKSLAFSINRKGNYFEFSGYGFGHHIGLCQWGARAMVAAGHLYPEILSFYYPDTTFCKLQINDAVEPVASPTTAEAIAPTEKNTAISGQDSSV